MILPNGKQITIDCVVHQFNYEEPYSEKEDTPMDLEYLNGVTDSTMNRFSDRPDLMGIMDEHEALATLGKILKRKANSGGGGNTGGSHPAPNKKPWLSFKKTPEQIQAANVKKATAKAQTKKFLGKGLHVTNRVNPVTVALRNGVLAGMKLNFLQVASNLRWTYLSDEQAQAKGVIMERFRKLKTVREKLEKIFYGAGGKPDNLKHAILTGKGNADKAVSLNGLGALSNVNALHEDMPLNQLLGKDIYYSENIEGLEGVAGLEGFRETGDLGSATAASVAAASSALTTIAALIKSIGSIFPNKTVAANSVPAQKVGKQGLFHRKSKQTTPSGASADETGSAATKPENSSDSNASASGGASTDSTENTSSPAGRSSGGGGGGSSGSGSGGGDDAGSSASEKGAEPSPAVMDKARLFWANNKKWLAPTGMVVGTLGVITLIYSLVKKKEKTLSLNGLKKKPKQKAHLLNGIKHKKKGGHKHHTQPQDKKKSIALL